MFEDIKLLFGKKLCDFCGDDEATNRLEVIKHRIVVEDKKYICEGCLDEVMDFLGDRSE